MTSEKFTEIESNAIIERCPHDDENPYLIVSKALIRDVNISPECRWFIIYFLANKDGFPLNPTFIMKSQNIGKDRLYKIISEAINAGYVFRTAFLDEENLKRYKYIVSEKPKFKKCFPHQVFPDAEAKKPENRDELKKSFRCPGFQDTGIQDTEKPDSNEEHNIRIFKENLHKRKEEIPEPTPPKVETKKPKIEMNSKNVYERQKTQMHVRKNAFVRKSPEEIAEVCMKFIEDLIKENPDIKKRIRIDGNDVLFDTLIAGNKKISMDYLCIDHFKARSREWFGDLIIPKERYELHY